MANPGWYKDPKNENFIRYFDGTQWTANVKPLPEINTSKAPESNLIDYKIPTYSFETP